MLYVRGTLTPDATGTYYDAGEVNLHRYYERENSEYTISYSAGYWIIWGEQPDPLSYPVWEVNQEGVEGNYSPNYLATGTATVSQT